MSSHGPQSQDVPRWSPDGSELLFSEYEPELHDLDRQSAAGPSIFVVSSLGGVSRPIFQADYACWFTPDGSQLVTASAREHDPDFKGVRLVNALTGEAKEVHCLDTHGSGILTVLPTPASSWL